MSLSRAFVLVSLAVLPARAIEMSPIYGLQVLGGQNFYSGQRNSLSGNASAVVAPAMKVDDNWSVLPALESNYQGTEQVLDVVGAGTLFQSQWDNRAAIKGVYKPTDSLWRFKPSASFKYELLQQTKDEQLGKGLYDYESADAGFDAEYVYQEPFALRAGIDYYQNHFPNYTSLESQAATSFQGQSLARELVGNYVLDTQNVLLSFGGEGPITDRLILQGSGSLLYERFPEPAPGRRLGRPDRAAAPGCHQRAGHGAEDAGRAQQRPARPGPLRRLARLRQLQPEQL